MKRIQKICITFAITIALYTSFLPRVSAQYVLPYPSYMPGNKLYVISRLFDTMKSYWYFGDIGQTRYHMALSDKYLVEAKTLFAYKQYLLGTEALGRSNSHVLQLGPNLLSAKQNKKDVALLVGLVREESIAHLGVLTRLMADVPEVFVWEPERSAASTLNLHAFLKDAMDMRLQEASFAAHL